MDYSVGWLGAFHQDLELKNIEKIRDWLQMTEMDLCSLHSGSSNNEWTKEMEDQWRVARKMLCEVISSAKGNGELGAIVVSFCLSLLHVLHSASPREAVLTACPSTGVLIFARNRRDITMEISQHITTLKSCGSVDSSPVGSVTVLLSQPTLKELWQRWLKMDVVEAVRSGLESQQMALITSFLTSKGLWKPTEVNETIQSIGKEWVQELLTEGRVEKSTSVLVNMGHEPVVYLKEVLLSTKQRSIRQLLHSHLSEYLSAQEERILTFIQKVDDAISNISQQHSNRDVPLEGFLTADQVLKYSEGEITAIALEIAHLTQECPLPDIKSLLSWQWLLSRNSLTQLLGWVECSLGGQKKGEVLNEWLNARGMTEDMVESVIDSPAMTCVKNRVLNRLCQYGIFSHNEDKDASLFLRRLLLSNFNLFAISDLRNTYMGNEYLHQLTLHHYAKLNLPCALVSHVDSFTQITLPILQDLQTDAPWVTLLQECVAAGDILQLALATLNHLNVGQTSYLSNKPHLAFAIAMLDKQNIKSLCTGDQQSNIQGVNLLESLSSIPLVKKALITTEVLQPAERTSIYSLLKGSLTFDLSRTLGWMDQKRGASESDIPHFSNPEIVDKYSHQEPLGFVFYLRQGRPSYAAVSLLVELWTKDKMFYKHRLREACNIAHGLAFGVYPSRRVLCACVAFIAMVGCPSQLLRSTIALADGCINKQISKEEQNRIVHRIRQLPLNSLESVSLLSCLERCIISSSPMTNVEDSSSCVSSIKDWSLCVHFAQEHHLTYPETMLVHCAREGQWIPFLIIAHVFQYPKEQIVNLLSHFKSSSLRSHLHCSLLHPIRFPSHQSNKERRDPLVANRDTRRSLYSKIGLHKEKQECDSTSSSPRQDDDFSPGSPTNLSTISSYSEEDKSIDNEMVSSHNDLFSVVYYCHSTPYPSQSLLSNAISLNNPTYAAIARLYQESCVISCLSTWLYCSLSPHHQLELSEIFKQPIKMLQWTKEEVGEIMELAFRRGYVATVKEAARMFLTQEHPLTSLLSFLYEAITSYEGDMALVHLKAFQAACYNFKYMPSRTEDTLDLHWVATTSVSLLYCTLCHCLKTPAYKERFCRLVLSVNFKDHLPMHKGSFADFSVLANLQSCLLETNIQIYFDFLLCGSRSVSFTVETQRLLQTALENRYFDAATKIAQIIGQSTDHIVIAQLSWEYLSEEESHFLELEVSRLSFWDRCNRRLRAEASMEGHKAAVFFKDHACYSRTRKERLHILSLSWNWINECGNNRETSSGTSSDGCKLLSDEDNSVASVEELMGQVEVELWQCRILDYIDGNRDVSSYVNPISQQGLCLVSHLIKPVHSSEILLTGAAEMTALEDIMGELLDMGDVATVYRLKEMFQHPCKDLELVQLCMHVSEGEKTANEVSVQVQKIVTKEMVVRHRRRTLSSRGMRHLTTSSWGMVMVPPVASSFNDDELLKVKPKTESEEALEVIEELVGYLNRGQTYGHKIIACMRVSMALGKEYKDVATHSAAVSLLGELLRGHVPSRVFLAQDLLSFAPSIKTGVADFLCQEIVAAITRGKIQEVGGRSDTNYLLDLSHLDMVFPSLLSLCEDSSLLGDRLMGVAVQMGITQTTQNVNEVLSMVVELLIRSHSCYTHMCNMEGICSVLKKANGLVLRLKEESRWGLMVRLLTGIGRYSELSFVFRILHEADQFEFLLRKGMDRVPLLKEAILEYLRKCCPEKNDLLRLVASHFKMHFELAKLWHEEAQSTVQTLIDQSQPSATPVRTLINDKVTKETIDATMDSFAHATRFYVEAQNMSLAQMCGSKAQLLALQKFLVCNVASSKPAPCVLILNDKQTVTYLLSHDISSFHQAQLIISCCSIGLVDWSSVLYKHGIIDGSNVYLEDFLSTYSLTRKIMEDIVAKYQLESSPSRLMEKQIRRLVLSITHVELRYVIASHLGLKDVIKNILCSDSVHILKDTVWKDGTVASYSAM